ncbi:chymotrypsin-2-like [Contarinia nasturtii]|uniref:chymotrypsin-2-like n=1 Tax=Contarinia nasturtii TaxID=265458 RepID=UPI0012D3DCE2|nr:chymotrypsin-2-like [Contarinia nasturtii]
MNLFYALFSIFSLAEYIADSQIIDGELVDKIEDSNFVVGIQYHKSFTHHPFNCAGTIVSNCKIVTAAHCVFGRSSFTLIFGTIDLHKPIHTVNITENDIIVHPIYSKKSPWFNDIAVIELKKKLKFSPMIDKIDMVDEGYVAKTDDQISMFGFTESIHPDRTPKRSNLRSVNSTIADFETCKSSYWNKCKDRVLENQRQFCVSLRNGTHNLTNSGDSGGPVITKDRKFLGVISYDAQQLPEVCTFIAGHRLFIQDPRAFVSSFHQLFK